MAIRAPDGANKVKKKIKEECNKEKTSVHEKKGVKKVKASRAFTFALVERIVYHLLTGIEVVKLKKLI